FSEHRRRVIRDAVLDRPLDTACVDGLPVSDHVNAGRIQHLEIFERVAVDDDQIGEVTGPHAAQAIIYAQNFRIVAGALLYDLERMKAGLLMQFHLANETEAVHLIDEARVFAATDQAAALVELAQSRHPDAIVLLPKRFVGGSPTDEV